MTRSIAGPSRATGAVHAPANPRAIAPGSRRGPAPPRPAPSGPAHLAHLRRHPTPWAVPPEQRRGPVAPPEGPAGPHPAGDEVTPVFVDDSGRRRRVGRWIGSGLAAVVLGYVAVVAMAFADVPLVGRLAPPGVEQLSRPAGDPGVSQAPGAEERPLPAAVAEPGPPDPPDDDPPSALDRATAEVDHDTASTGEDTATVTTGVTTTAAPPGNGATTSVPTPRSTVPGHSRATGPPTDRPGRP